MTLDTNISTKPYFDDFDQTKNYYQVLYRPSIAVQTRELNSMQSMLQDQINKFGRNIYKDGSVVEGCSFTFDNNYYYVKINDTYANNYAIPNIASFQGLVITNPRGLNAIVVNTIDGYQSQDPNLNTLYVKYLNSTTYVNGAVQQAFANGESLQLTTTAGAQLGNVVVATVVNSTGTGYAFTTTEGVIFKKGFFLRVPAQTLVISKYSNVPDNISVGFAATETLITPEIDNNLVDNAAGSPNYSAPGAHRLQIIPNLVTRATSDTANTTTFFSLCDFSAGQPVSVKSDPQYAALGADMARRTYETSGDYVVNPFLLSTQIKTDSSGNANTNYMSLVSSPGIGYVKGYRVEFINNNTVPLRKGIDTETVANQIVSANYGYYFNVNQFVGDFNNDNIVQVELHSTAKNAITNKTFLAGYSSSAKIGTAYVRGVAYSSGTPGVDAVYKLYLFNVNMAPGYSVENVKSVVYQVASAFVGVADVVLTYSSTIGANIAVLQDTANEIMVHPFGQKALSTTGFASEQFVYRNRANANFLTTGVMSLTLPSADGTGSEQFYQQGSYSTSQEQTYIIIPTATGYSANKTGTVSGTSGSNALTGSGTAFTSQYTVGDYIYIYSEAAPQRITAIASDISLSLANNLGTSPSSNTHQKVWPAGVPINFNTAARTISATATTATLTLGETTNAAFQSSVYLDVLRSSTRSIQKSINRGSLVQINISNNAGGTTGPWCLGLPDVFQLNHVWVGSGTYSNANADQVSRFYIDNGQRDAFYGLAYLYSTGPVSNTSTLLISVDNFTKSETQGHGYFNANSYPIDDANTANTLAIQTYQIPQYVSRNTGTSSDLRDCIDFRPYAANTANLVTTTTNITTNPVTTTTISVPTPGSYLPSPDSFYEASITHYLPRVDRIALTTGGSMVINEGISSNLPAAGLEAPGTMTIGLVSIPPYPSLTPSVAKQYNRYDYAVQITMQQTRRFTMADIGKISNRIDRLEYYTSLSLLEQSAQSLQIRSSTTGQNRFKNGIMVDPFKDFTLSNTNDPQYRIAIDSSRNEGRPYFSTHKVGMYFDSVSSSNVQKTGDMVTLPYITSVYQSQPYASKYHNCIEGNVYTYRGTITLDPPGTVDPDLTVNPDIVSNIDLSANWVNLQQYIGTAWGTSWGAWTTTGSSTSTQTGASQLVGQTQNADGSIAQNYQTQVINTTTSQLQQLGQQLSVQPTQTQVNLGNYVTNVSLLPYIKPTFILFKAVGMKPSAKLYAYFNSVPVSAQCMPVTPYSGSITTVGGVATANDGSLVYYDTKGNTYKFASLNWGGTLSADSTGTVYGIFAVPGNTFNSGQLEFKLTDISNLSQGESAVTTQATSTYFGSPISVQTSQAVLQVRSATVSTQEVIQQQTVQQSSVSYTSSVISLPAPAVNPSTPPAPSAYDGRGDPAGLGDVQQGNAGGVTGFGGAGGWL